MTYTDRRRAERATAGQPREGDFPGLGEAAVRSLRAADPKDGPQVLRMADVTPERVSWLWPGRIPAGKLTVIDGDPGDGKSTLSLDLAARVSTGSAMPDGTRAAPGNVLILSAEDGVADTIRPRLDAAGADPERVAVLTEMVEDGTGRPVELPGDLRHVTEIVRQHAIRLVIIDPLAAFLAGVDAHVDQSVRRALHPISKLAEASGAAVVVIRHLNKAPGGKAMYRGGGSIGITGAARAVHLVAADPDDDTRRLLAAVKINVARKPETMAFRLVNDELHGCARIAWEGTSAHSADDLVATEEDRQSRTDAVAVLTEALANGARRSREITEELRERYGIAGRTLERARKKAGVTAHKIGHEWWLDLSKDAKTATSGHGGVGGLDDGEPA